MKKLGKCIDEMGYSHNAQMIDNAQIAIEFADCNGMPQGENSFLIRKPQFRGFGPEVPDLRDGIIFQVLLSRFPIQSLRSRISVFQLHTMSLNKSYKMNKQEPTVEMKNN